MWASESESSRRLVVSSSRLAHAECKRLMIRRSLQRHCRANQGPIFLHLHLWLHTILVSPIDSDSQYGKSTALTSQASGFLTGSNLLRRGSVHGPSAGLRSGAATPTTATASTLWRNSARTIGDILVLTDIINPYSYFALPFVNQAFFVAGCCYVKGENGEGVGMCLADKWCRDRTAPESTCFACGVTKTRSCELDDDFCVQRQASFLIHHLGGGGRSGARWQRLPFER
jgi:hypothetical protein